MIRSVCLACYLLLFYSSYNFAQNYTVKNHNNIKGKSIGATVLGTDEEGYIYLASEKRIQIGFSGWIAFNWVKVIDPIKGKLVSERNLKYKDLKNQGYKSKFVKVIDNKALLFVKNKEDDYAIVELDKNLNIKGKPVIIGKGHDKTTLMKNEEFDFHHSKDINGVNYFLTFNESSKNNFTISIKGFDKNLTTIKDIEVKIPATKGRDFNFLAYDDDTQLLYFNDPKTYKSMNVYNGSAGNLFIIREGEAIELELDVEETGCVPSNVSFVRSEEKVLIAGNIQKEDGGNYIGVFSSKFDFELDELDVVEVELFEKEFVAKNAINYKKLEKEFPNNYNHYKSIKTEDGGAVFFYQWYNYTQRSPPEIESDIYFYGALIALKINSAGEQEWMNLIPINQINFNYNPGVGFVAMEKGGEVFVMHVFSDVRKDLVNDDLKSEYKAKEERKIEKVAITRISQKGILHSTNIVDGYKEKFFFDPSQVYVDSENKKFVMFAKLKNLSKKKENIMKTIQL